MAMRSVFSLVTCLILGAAALAQTAPVTTARGKVLKADKESLTLQPRDDGGKFGKAITLRVTGTTRITTLAPQTRDKKLVMTQKETDAKDLTAGQMISVIYATPKGEDPVLLSGVVEPPEK
jgi:hypothetical protein